MGLFHQASNGKGVAAPDPGLTPAPPAPVPYVNISIARDVAKGSKKVKIQASSTALETSEVSTSSGDEAATAGGGVLSHNTKGKSTFTTWSFTVKIEGKGVVCHGDLMNQNNNGTILNCICAAALVQFAVALYQLGMLGPCDEPYNPDTHRPPKNRDPSPEQKNAVDGKPCWECARDQGNPDIPPIWNTEATGKVGDVLTVAEDTSLPKQSRQLEGKTEGKEAMTHDHQPPIGVAWEMGGCHMGLDKFHELFAKPEMVKPHCNAHYRSQGGRAGGYQRHLRRGG